jgi:hypothetical protein
MKGPNCRVCKESKTPELMKKGWTKTTGRGICKKCHTSYCIEHEIFKKAQIAPWNYSQCECGRIVSYKTEKCPKCGSLNIDDYID